MPPSPMRSAASWTGQSEVDTLYHTAGHKGQAKQGGTNHWVVSHGGAARNGSPGGAMTTKIGPRASLGSAAGGCRRPSDAGLYRQDGAEGRRHRYAAGQPTLDRFGQ